MRDVFQVAGELQLQGHFAWDKVPRPFYSAEKTCIDLGQHGMLVQR